MAELTKAELAVSAIDFEVHLEMTLYLTTALTGILSSSNIDAKDGKGKQFRH